jgi:hypothetical protein
MIWFISHFRGRIRPALWGLGIGVWGLGFGIWVGDSGWGFGLGIWVGDLGWGLGIFRRWGGEARLGVVGMAGVLLVNIARRVALESGWRLSP